VYEIMWKNMVQRGRPHMSLWRMRIAYWIIKATDTHTEYVIFPVFPQQQLLHESASMLLYIQTLSVLSLRRVKEPIMIYFFLTSRTT
jgi:hypothetical protein